MEFLYLLVKRMSQSGLMDFLYMVYLLGNRDGKNGITCQQYELFEEVKAK